MQQCMMLTCMTNKINASVFPKSAKILLYPGTSFLVTIATTDEFQFHITHNVCVIDTKDCVSFGACHKF